MIRLPRGTQDILPQQWPRWKRLFDIAENTAEASGFGRIETPVFESTRLFTHATGEHTDVNREMYTFQDRGGDDLSLRPEGTAAVFRAYFEHGMQVQPQPVRLYYLGSMFRYERPQSGRLREHHQFGCEAIGSEDALIDSSMVDLQSRFYRRSGVAKLTIHVNSIGDQNCRPAYIHDLVAYLSEHEEELCSQCRERIRRNPLRVLDCKVPSCQSVLDRAPRMLDALCFDCKAHWARFRLGLDSLGIDHTVNTRLVRGLDYYTRTVWEFLPQTEGGAQSVVGAGGRYDALAAAIGRPPTPGVGFSTGLERLMLNIPGEVLDGFGTQGTDVFLAHVGGEAELMALSLVATLLERGIRAEMAFGQRSLKTQLKHANSRAAKVAVIVGDDEIARGVAAVRDLVSGTQEPVPIGEVAQRIIDRQAAMSRHLV